MPLFSPPIIIQADIRKPNNIKKPVVTQNDSVVLQIEVFENKNPFDLSGAVTVSLASVRKDGVVVTTPGTAIGNVATFNLGTNEVAITGEVKAKAQFYDADGRISTLSFAYLVEQDPTGSGFIPSEDEETLIEFVMNNAQQKIDELSDVDVVALTAQVVDISNQKVTFEQFGAVGNGVTYDTTAIQNAINYASSMGLKIECPKNKVYRINKVGSVTYALGNGSNTSDYSIKIPDNTSINFNGSKVLLNDADYASFFTNDGVFDVPKRLNKNIWFENYHCIGNSDTAIYKTGKYNPALNFFKAENLHFFNGVCEKVFDTGLRILSANKVYLDKLVSTDVRGNGFYLGIQKLDIEDLRVTQAEIGSLTAFNIREGNVGSSCNPFIGCLVNSNVNSIAAYNAEMGHKFHNECENVNVNSVFFDGGAFSTNNSGLKIQGISDTNLLTGINVGNVISKNCGGSGLYIQYAKNVNIGNYIGENNGIIEYSDVWVHKENITINSINITRAHNSGVQLRTGCIDIKINNITATDVKGSIISDLSSSAFIGNVTVKGSDVNFPTSYLYLNTVATARSVIDKLTKLSSVGSTPISILSPFVSIKRLELATSELLEYEINMTAGTRTDIMNGNILYQSNGAGGNVRPFVVVNQLTGVPVKITNQIYITGGYRLTHETALGTEKMLVSIRDVHI